MFSLPFLLITSCKEDKKEGAKGPTMKEVIAVHDEAMPKLKQMGPLVEKLIGMEDSTEMGLKYKAAREDLQAAHKGMMDWMKGFGAKFDSDEILNGKALTEEKQQWLEEEAEYVKAVRDHINNSIANAESLLHEH